ncbi:hypothetical protein HY490_05340 [Candidatus Woesearchaeota archaeon]|nr:hypothetical protein [Candidatus Woesearchaeota archaeon]
MLTPDEQQFLRSLVIENLKHFRKEKKLLTDVDVSFLKAQHQLEHFLVDLAKKLE